MLHASTYNLYGEITTEQTKHGKHTSQSQIRPLKKQTLLRFLSLKRKQWALPDSDPAAKKGPWNLEPNLPPSKRNIKTTREGQGAVTTLNTQRGFLPFLLIHARTLPSDKVLRHLNKQQESGIWARCIIRHTTNFRIVE
jgi:hypothetical protein